MKRLVFCIMCVLCLYPDCSMGETPVYNLSIKDHTFVPDILEVPAGIRFKLLIKNLDPSAEEFESFDLKREKIVPSNGKIRISLPPLKPGEYKFFGDFHPKTAQGKIIAKEIK